MKTLFTSLIALLLFPLFLAAQSDYKKGYVLLTQFDTLSGEIDNNSYYYNSIYCDFKADDSDSIVRFLPEDIYGYRFLDGKFYISKEVDVDNEKEQFFLEFLIDGELDIYFRQDKGINNHYYASKTDSLFADLKYSKEIKYVEGKNIMYESKNYQGILNYFTMDCPELRKDIAKMSYPRYRDLINFANEYHDLICDDYDCVIYEKKMSFSMSVNIVGGFNYSFKDYASDYGLHFPSYGINFLFQNLQVSERYYLGIGVLYDSEGKYGKKEIRVPLSINYMHPDKKWSPVFSYGLDWCQAICSGRYQIPVFSFFMPDAC